jgi:hypothetical protein
MLSSLQQESDPAILIGVMRVLITIPIAMDGVIDMISADDEVCYNYDVDLGMSAEKK